MKSKNIIILLFVIAIGCKENSDNFVYEKTLLDTVKINNPILLPNKKTELNSLDTLNFHFLKNKIEITNNYTENLEFNNFIIKNIPHKKMFYYGEKNIDNFKYFLFSFEHIFEGYSDKTIGYLGIENSNKSNTTLIKVFHHEIENECFLRAFLLKNYIIILNTCDSEYDIVNSKKKKNIITKYCIVEINNGNINLLEERDCKKILKSYLKN